MANNPSMRHVEALLNQVMSEDIVTDVLRKGLEAFLSALMESEVSEQIGAEHGERTAERATSRNGYRTRSFNTGLGTSELAIPKIRKGTYFPSFLRSRKRSDDALVLAVATCFQQGVSTRKVEAIAQALGVESLKKSTVSKMAETLQPQVDAFQSRALGEFPYVWLDARYEFVREEHRVHKVAVLVAVGVRSDGMREVLGFGVERVENEVFWDRFIESLVNRGLTGVRLAISDAHQGLRNAIAKRLPSAMWQRCRVHFTRNIGQLVGRRQRPSVLALVKTVFAQESYDAALKQRVEVAKMLRHMGKEDVATFLEEADEVLTYMLFPSEHWTKLHSTNFVERINRELKRRTRVVSIFPNRRSLNRLIGALLLEEHEEWLVARRYISERSMMQLKDTKQLTSDPKQLAAK